VFAVPRNDELLERITTALRSVYDPELGIDVISLGLVYAIEYVDDRVVVTMTLTTPGCPVSESLPQEALRVVSDAIAGSGYGAEMQVVWDPPWTPERIDPTVAASLGLRVSN
jgi:metal-sulfur cluster biosynthetic enzyme